MTVEESTVVGVLAALGVRADTEADCAAAISELDRQHWARALPPTIVVRSGTEASFWVHVDHGAPAHVWVRMEDGTVRSGIRQADNFTPPFDLAGRLVGEATFVLPADLPLGYHRVHLRSGDRESDTPLIVTPAWLGLPERMGNRRVWGLATQLYSVRSAGSWGIGDLSDLTDLAVWAGSEHSAGYVLINPLHAAAPTSPMEPSPYLPTSRRFVNPLYLRVEAIPEYARVSKRGRLDKLRAGCVEGAASPTSSTATPPGMPSGRRSSWCTGFPSRPVGSWLSRPSNGAKAPPSMISRRGARWPRSTAVTGDDGPPNCTIRPVPRLRSSPRRTGAAVDFHRWLQWQLDDQLAHAQSQALRTGMTLGIMADLAVGVHPSGADAWALQDVLALGVTAGAPPDEFNQLGQDWSQPPWRPDRLEELGYQPFRSLIAAILRHAGGVRIDHIIGLFRLWWIPAGAPPTEGHLCALQPRRDDRHRGTGGAPGRCGGGR